MLHEIEGEEYRCEFKTAKARDEDYLLSFRGEEILMSGDGLSLPCFSRFPEASQEARYLFAISDRAFFMTSEPAREAEGLRYFPVRALRLLTPRWMAFAGVTGYHLSYWYAHNRYCGVCAGKMEDMQTERALRCAKCGNIKYPDIAVAVIVGILRGEEILLTKYAGGAYRQYALVAGYAEIGEALEDTVRRETMEETGLRVSNIRYYNNQPWGFSRTLLVGFFADLSGSPDIRLQESELSEAVWVRREDVPDRESDVSLTSLMMSAFKKRLV